MAKGHLAFILWMGQHIAHMNKCYLINAFLNMWKPPSTSEKLLLSQCLRALLLHVAFCEDNLTHGILIPFIFGTMTSIVIPRLEARQSNM